MPDDEPLDDARAVATAAAAAAAKVAEIAARAAADHKTRQQRPPIPEPLLSYDSSARREATDQAMQAAGVADEPRKARTTADLLNGADPQTAAASGRATKTRAPQASKLPEQARSR